MKKKKVEDENIIEMCINHWRDGYKKTVLQFLAMAIPLVIIISGMILTYLYFVIKGVLNYVS